MNRILLVGNPNVGKTTLFNKLTGLNRKVANYSGVTVDIFSSKLSLPKSGEVKLIDLPGICSFNSLSDDEELAVENLFKLSSLNYKNLIFLITNSKCLERSFFLSNELKKIGESVLIVFFEKNNFLKKNKKKKI